MTSPASPWLHQRVDGTFVGPVVPLAPQPVIRVVPIDWNSFDVPRLWDMVRREDDPLAWRQAQGFENLAQLLLSHHDSLRRQRDALANGWNPETSLAAGKFLGFVDELIRSMAEDAIAHASTGRGLHSTLNALKVAKEKIGVMKQDWDNVTSDWVPEWWDTAADELNQKARDTIRQTEKMVGDHRSQLTVPSLYTYPSVVSDMQVPEPDDSRGGSSSRTQRTPVTPTPAVPGYNPVLSPGPDLQGVPLPRPVPAVPGSPISLLPVPPGNPYAPNGGAYVLPGPGIGRGGWIYPMPMPPQASAATAAVGRGASAAGATGLMPAAMPMAGGGQVSSADRPRRRGDLVWQIAKGVPPVIGEVPPEQQVADSQRRFADETFVDWFADLATPWATDLKPHVGREAESS